MKNRIHECQIFLGFSSEKLSRYRFEGHFQYIYNPEQQSLHPAVRGDGLQEKRELSGRLDGGGLRRSKTSMG